MTRPGPGVAAFEALDFDPDSFDHEAHVFVARELVTRYGQEEAGIRFSRTLKGLTDRLGIPDKFHETITRFYIIAIAERLRRSPDAGWQAFKAGNPDLFDGTLLTSSYSPERLGSAEAHRYFLLPDLARAA